MSNDEFEFLDGISEEGNCQKIFVNTPNLFNNKKLLNQNNIEKKNKIKTIQRKKNENKKSTLNAYSVTPLKIKNNKNDKTQLIFSNKKSNKIARKINPHKINNTFQSPTFKAKIKLSLRIKSPITSEIKWKNCVVNTEPNESFKNTKTKTQKTNNVIKIKRIKKKDPNDDNKKGENIYIQNKKSEEINKKINSHRKKKKI